MARLLFAHDGNGGSGAGIGNGEEEEEGSNVAVTLGYTPAARDAVSITASSYAGTVTLEQPFTNGILTLGPGAVDNLGHIDNYTLTAATRVVTVKGVTGSFNDKIKLNFYLDIPKTVMEEDSVYVSMRNERTNETKITFVSSKNYDQDKRAYRFSIPLAAKEASDTITASILGGDDVIPLIGEKTGTDYTETGVPYSLMEYFNWLEKEGRDANEKAIGKAARDYCTAAQLYFDYNVTEDMSVSDAVRQLSADTLSGYIAVRDGELPSGVSISGITGMLESDNTLRLYYSFTGVDPDDLTFEIDGKRLSSGVVMTACAISRWRRACTRTTCRMCTSIPCRTARIPTRSKHPCLPTQGPVLANPMKRRATSARRCTFITRLWLMCSLTEVIPPLGSNGLFAPLCGIIPGHSTSEVKCPLCSHGSPHKQPFP